MPACNFFVGQKVVCVDPSRPSSLGRDWDALQGGAVYTIREIAPVPEGTWIEPPHHEAPAIVRLVEIVRRKHERRGIELAYACTRFRPATDISSLEALLKKAPTPAEQKENEDA